MKISSPLPCMTLGLAVMLSIAYSTSTSAQIRPDGTLPNPTQVNLEGQVHRITGGTSAGNNLFHSFQDFSVSTGGTAYFDNNITIQNIFSRVTGRSISNIDGLIRANGTANLFLLNPNGILFGPNARLNLGGSFLASTATHLNFADGTVFSTLNPQTPSLLTISVPIGLQFGSSPNPIRVIGTGHSFRLTNPIIGQVEREPNTGGLQVQPGNTLALLGGDVALVGGTLAAPGGRVELGSVDRGIVKLETNPSGFAFNYQEVSVFRDIQLSQLASVEVIGEGGGAIAVQGRQISLADGSVITMQNLGSQPSGSLNLTATESVKIVGNAPDARIRTLVTSETKGGGNGAPLNVNTKRLMVQDAGALYTATFSPAPGGNLTVNASDSIEISGFSSLNPVFSSFIGTPTYTSGPAGNITLSARNVKVLEGGGVIASTFGTASSGNIIVNAESVEVAGINSQIVQPSNLVTATFNQGNAGNLVVNTARLAVKNGGTVNAGTAASGNAGSITVNASESVEVSGTVLGSIPTSVASAAEVANENLRQIARLPDKPTGDSADVTINTPLLRVEDGGIVNVRNLGSGQAGTLRVNADKISLDSGGGITATTISGEGGNVLVQTRNLQLRNGSQITATAGGTGQGGNLTIEAAAIAAIENSSLAANAVQGRGGNIQITTQGLFQSANSPITATSEFGLAGVVQLNTPNVNPSSGLVKLPEKAVDVAALIDRTPCRGNSDGSFTVTGKGGLPPSPEESFSSSSPILDWAIPEGEGRKLTTLKPDSHRDFPASITQELVEATGWTVATNGQIRLTTQTIHSAYSSGLTSPSCR